MLLKRIYASERNPDGSPVCIRVQVRHTGTHAEQRFSSRLVAAAIGDGWMAIDGDLVVISAEPEDLVYIIVRRPGYYCCHDGQPIPISAVANDERLRTGRGRLAAAEAQAYLATRHAGTPSPDPAHPAGYVVIDHYECVIAPEQHAKFKHTA